MSQTAAESDRISGFAPPRKPRSRHFRTVRVVAALILRETGAREKGASLGFLWNMIDPIFTVIVLSIGFSLIARTPRLGTNFVLYYVTGVVPFHVYSTTAAKVAGSIRYSRNLLGFPAVTVVDAIFARFLLNYFTSVMIFVILIGATMAYYQLWIIPDWGALLMSLAMAGSLGLGIGTMNSVLFLASPTYANIWGILNRPLALLSGVLFLISDLPEYIFRYLWWNPMAHLVAEMRHAFFPGYVESWVSPLYVFSISAVTFTVGLIGLHRYVFDALDR